MRFCTIIIRTWSYLKNFLEGGSIPVARPKNRGGNQIFHSDAPVFITAPQEISLWRYGEQVYNETAQMKTRVKYLHLHHKIPDEDRREVAPCGHCAARLYARTAAVFGRLVKICVSTSLTRSFIALSICRLRHTMFIHAFRR